MQFIEALRWYLSEVERGLADDRRSPSRVYALRCSDAIGIGAYEYLATYAFENRLVRRDAAGLGVSSLGIVLLRLPGTDALQWLLRVESLQSVGWGDPWRVCHKLLKVCLDLHEPGWEIDPSAPVMASVRRLMDLGVVWPDPVNPRSLVLNENVRALLEEIVSVRQTPQRTLAEALLADERNATWDALSPAHARPHTESVAALNARHARMILHEFRNALVPVRMTLDRLYPHVPAHVLEQLRPRVDQGLDRVFNFLSEMQKVTDLSARAPERFDPVAAVRDALIALNGGLAIRVRFDPPPEVPTVVGYRDRFVLVMVNLLRNSAQNSERPTATAVISVDSRADDAQVIIAVDDDGPGIPERHRESLFRLGFSMRPGGTGQGLALVHEICTVEMKGQVQYEPSALGGARFVLTLPAAPEGATQ